VKLVDLVNFFKSPPDREVIARWTKLAGASGHRLELPSAPDPERYCFLALGDSGDSAAMGTRLTPQDAVAKFMAEDAALPETGGDARFVLHTGDVVYMTGERRLYDRNFRRPYAAFLTPESTVDNLVFRLPFLPVPGNHDYYDFSGWATQLTKLPVIGAGVAAIARELFSFQIPQGGSDMGAAYMNVFVDGDGSAPVYEPGVRTRIPNRYYRFRVGSVDFFALDSNTLDAPPPETDLAAERERASQRVGELEKKAKTLRRQILRDEKAVDGWLRQERQKAAEDAARVQVLRASGEAIATSLRALAAALDAVPAGVPKCGEVRSTTEQLLDRWQRPLEGVVSRRDSGRVAEALEQLDDVGDDLCELLEDLEHCFAELPEGADRSALLTARENLVQANEVWRKQGIGVPPPELCERLQQLSAQALAVQRQLAVERRRQDRRPEDYDSGQLEWLRASIEESVRDNPEGWRVVFLHQPLYTTIGDHSENFDVVGVRENLVPLLRDRVHLVLAGHAHAFEWFRSTALPTTGLIVTGGGGQQWLWRSILHPRRFRQYRPLYRSLREAGATETALAGAGPPADDGEDASLYHYVRVEVTPETLTVVPIGVRRAAGEYRREVPMPVYYVPEFPPLDEGGRPKWERRRLAGVVVRRGQPPEPRWAD
jgi:3',5'-cyclic AMP phosphodiesterase CpdA